MTETPFVPETCFEFGTTRVQILEGDILHPQDNGQDVQVDAVVSSDDNYLTMGSGVSARLRDNTGLPEEQRGYIREAQRDAPVKAGTVVVTRPYDLRNKLGVDCVFHGTVIDYDAATGDVLKGKIVERTTANCLAEAENRGLRSILFPAFAAGAGGLAMEDCARRMCTAIKTFLAQQRRIERIYVIIYRPESKECFVREANLVLGVPYNPEQNRRQVRDFFGREEQLRLLQDIITGELDDDAGKRHAVILGGPGIGKEVILDRLYSLSQEKDSPLAHNRLLVRLTFGGVHANTPLSFVYRKFLHAMGEETQDPDLRAEIRSQYAEPDLDRDHFLAFLEKHQDYYPDLVFLVDRLPRLLKTVEPGGISTFWADLDRLQEQMRFVWTARDEDYQELERDRLGPQTESFKHQIQEVRLACVTEDERRRWVDELFRRYLDSADGAPVQAQEFVEQEGGQHPYLISLVSYALIERLKRESLEKDGRDWERMDQISVNALLEEVLDGVEQARNRFFEKLINFHRRSRYWDDYRWNLETLAKAVAIAGQAEAQLSALAAGDPNASPTTMLAEEWELRRSLDPIRLRELIDQGLLFDASDQEDVQTDADMQLRENVQFMAKSFADYVRQTLVDRWGPGDQPDDVVISILKVEHEWIRTIFRDRRAKVITASKPFPESDKHNFKQELGDYIQARFPTRGDAEPPTPVFDDTEEIGNYILTQFTTNAIKTYLHNAPRRSTVLLMIDEAYADIPWELMLEAVYAGELPFQVGRAIVSEQRPTSIRPLVRGIHKVKTLLIGNPSGDEHLRAAEEEVRHLADAMRRHPEVFSEPDVLIGPEKCQQVRLLNALSSGKYCLVHYSGHTGFEADQSAWLVADGKITTHQLTSAVEMAPPALVFSSSCESAVGGEAKPVRYEDQVFDLPGAFLQAGVEAYIGTLWKVDATASRLFSEEFYKAFLSGKHDLGECLRRAKWARKQREEAEGQINWLAFILYGDPHLAPGDLFPAMRRLREMSYG